MRLQLEIKDGPEGLTVHAWHEPDWRSTLVRIGPPLVLALVLWLLGSGAFMLGIALAGILVRGAWLRLVGIDAFFRITREHLISRQPQEHSPETSFPIARIASIEYASQWWVRRGIPGLYAFQNNSSFFRARICLLPWLSFSQSLDVIEAIRPYLGRQRSL